MRPLPFRLSPLLPRGRWQVLALLAAVAAAWACGIREMLSWQMLATQYSALAAAVNTAPLLSGVAYVALYVGVVTLSLPGATFLTLTGGLLFGPWVGGALAGIAAGVGACLAFLLVRGALAPRIARHAGSRAKVLRRMLEDEGFLYLLSLRLLPLLPFWLVNLAAALTGMRFVPYAAATMLGIMPGALAYAGVGAGLDSVLASGKLPDLAALSSLRVLMPLGGLALLSLCAALWRRHFRILQAGSPATE